MKNESRMEAITGHTFGRSALQGEHLIVEGQKDVPKSMGKFLHPARLDGQRLSTEVIPLPAASVLSKQAQFHHSTSSGGRNRHRSPAQLQTRLDSNTSQPGTNENNGRTNGARGFFKQFDDGVRTKIELTPKRWLQFRRRPRH